MNTSNQFFLRKITDYWGYGAIERWASTLDAMDSEMLSASETELGAAVMEHTRVLADELLQLAAIAMMDDLYKNANMIDVWNDSVTVYLRATAGIFSQLLAQRGFILHYVVDNSFEDMQRPLQLFPIWYSACGIEYVCPQLLTAQDGYPPSESRRRCTATLRASGGSFHYIMLDTDSAEDSFTAPLEQREGDKVITILRTEAPIPGSNVQAYVSGRIIDGSG